MLHKLLFLALLLLTTYSNARMVLVNDVRIFESVNAKFGKDIVLVKDGFFKSQYLLDEFPQRSI